MSFYDRGDYSLSTLTVNGEDVTDLMSNITIIQDINNNYVNGNIILRDNYIIENMELKGGEDIVLKYKNKFGSWSWKFKILFIEILDIDRNIKHYNIKFVDDIYFSLQKNYSFSISNKKITQIINTLYYSKFGQGLPLKSDDTMWMNDFVFSNWTGDKIIDFLENRAYSTKGGVLFKFFRQHKNYSFKCIEDVFKESPIKEFYTTEIESPASISANSDVVSDVKFDVNGNKSNYQTGMEGNTTYVFDLFNKTILSNNVGKATDVKILKYRHDKRNNTLAHFEQIIPNRLDKAGKLNNSIAVIDVVPDNNNDVGNLYKLKIPNSSKDKKQELSPLSDNYICTKVVYKLNERITQTMTLQRMRDD